MSDAPWSLLPAVLAECREEQPTVIRRGPGGVGFRLTACQLVPRPRDEVFAYFSDAFNVEKLTPPWLKFSVQTPGPITIADGTIVDYRLRASGIPLRWRSLIRGWNPPVQFIDEQLRGPYRSWLHLHAFFEVERGTLCHDVVDYRVYGGALAHALFVRKNLLRIFAHRQQVLRQTFG